MKIWNFFVKNICWTELLSSSLGFSFVEAQASLYLIIIIDTKCPGCCIAAHTNLTDGCFLPQFGLSIHSFIDSFVRSFVPSVCRNVNSHLLLHTSDCTFYFTIPITSFFLVLMRPTTFYSFFRPSFIHQQQQLSVACFLAVVSNTWFLIFFILSTTQPNLLYVHRHVQLLGILRSYSFICRFYDGSPPFA